MTEFLTMLLVIIIMLWIALVVTFINILSKLMTVQRWIWVLIVVLSFNITYICSKITTPPVQTIYPEIPKVGRFIPPPEYRKEVTKWASHYQIPLDIATRLAWEESRWNPRAVNRNTNGSADYGLYQLNSYYFPLLTVEENIRNGLEHLHNAYIAKGSWRMAVVAYNAGINGSKNPPVRSLKHADRVVSGGL